LQTWMACNHCHHSAFVWALLPVCVEHTSSLNAVEPAESELQSKSLTVNLFCWWTYFSSKVQPKPEPEWHSMYCTSSTTCAN